MKRGKFLALALIITLVSVPAGTQRAFACGNTGSAGGNSCEGDETKANDQGGGEGGSSSGAGAGAQSFGGAGGIVIDKPLPAEGGGGVRVGPLLPGRGSPGVLPMPPGGNAPARSQMGALPVPGPRPDGGLVTIQPLPGGGASIGAQPAPLPITPPGLGREPVGIGPVPRGDGTVGTQLAPLPVPGLTPGDRAVGILPIPGGSTDVGILPVRDSGEGFISLQPVPGRHGDPVGVMPPPAGGGPLIFAPGPVEDGRGVGIMPPGRGGEMIGVLPEIGEPGFDRRYAPGSPYLFLQSSAVRVRDLPIAFSMSVGPDFRFDMLYDSLDDRSRTNRFWPVGYRWQHAYDGYLQAVGTNVGPDTVTNYHFHVGGGRYYAFTPDGEGGYKEEHGPGVNAKGGRHYLQKSDTNFVIHVRGGGEYRFTVQGRLIGVADRFGHALEIERDASNQVATIVSAASNLFTFAYSPEGYLTNIWDITGDRNASFSYSGDLLVGMMDMGGQAFEFDYDAQGRITELSRPSSTGGWDVTTLSYSGNPDSGAYAVTVTYPEGNAVSNVWGGTVTSTMDTYNGLGGATRKRPDWNYSWGEPYVESEDALGRVVSTIYYDNTGNAAIDGKVKIEVSASGVRREYTYTEYGDVSSIKRSYGGGLTILSVTTNTYLYFTNTWAPESVESETRDGAGSLMVKSRLAYSRDDRGTTNVWDDVFLLASRKQWISTNADDYAETRFTYTANFLVQTEQVLTGPGTNDFRVVWSNAYDSLHRMVERADAATNVVYFAYDDVNRLIGRCRWLARGSPGTNDDLAVVATYAYDDLDRLTNLLHADSFTESWTYAPSGCGVLTHVDRGGNLTTNAYDGNGRLERASTITTNGTVVAFARFTYNGAGQIAEVFDALTNRLGVAYNPAAQATNYVDALGREIQYHYDSAGRQHLTVFPDGMVFSNSYDAAGRLVEVSQYESLGGTALRSQLYTYDGLERVKTVTDPVGNVTSNTYDLLGRIVRMTHPDASYERTEYDRVGNVLKRIGPVPAGATPPEEADATTLYGYDLLNRLTSFVDSLSRTNAVQYDADHPLKVWRLLNANSQLIAENAYDPYTARLLTNVTYGVQTVFEYDALGHLTRVTYPDGSFAANVYDGPRLLAQTTRTGNTNSFGYDAAGRITSFTNSLGNVTRFVHDARGNITNVVDALTNVTAFAYNARDKVTFTTLPDGRVLTNSYDKAGNLLWSSGPGSIPATFTHDAAGRKVKLTDREGNAITVTYDSLDRMITRTYAGGTCYRYGWNARSWVTNRLDANGKTTRYEYDPVGQLTRIDYQTDTDVLFAYDDLGRLTNRVDAAGTWTWTYDGESPRILSESLASVTSVLSAVSYSYTSNTFDLASVACGTHTTLYSWAAGRLTNATSVSSAPSAVRSFSYSYVPNSDLISQVSSFEFQVSKSYDALNRLAALTNAFGTNIISSFQYDLDSTWRRTKRADVDGAETSWGYDYEDQLLTASRTNSPNGAADAAYSYGYQYDKVGNRLHEDRGQLDLDGAHNSVNELTHRVFGGKLDVVGAVSTTNLPCAVKVDGYAAAISNDTNFLGGARMKPGTNTISIVVVDDAGLQSNELRHITMPPTNPQLFQYDLNGNLTNDGWRAYTWDEENRLVAIQSTTNIAAAHRHRSEYLYDANSRRVEATDYVWNPTSSEFRVSSTRHFTYAGWNLIEELITDICSVITNSYTWGLDLSGTLQGAGGIGGLLAVLQDSAAYLPACDGNGNITEYADTNGVVVAHREYDPFGGTVAKSGSKQDAFALWFSTKHLDACWGLYYYGYRFYHPETGRWLGRDTLGLRPWRYAADAPHEEEYITLVGLLCQYVFCDNSAPNGTDPLGLQSARWWLTKYAPGAAARASLAAYLAYRYLEPALDVETIGALLKPGRLYLYPLLPGSMIGPYVVHRMDEDYNYTIRIEFIYGNPPEGLYCEGPTSA